MKTARSVFHLLLADFLERIRRRSFLALLVLTMYLTYLFVPPVDAGYQTVAMGLTRGIYNSPWMGSMMGIAVSTLVSLFAFYVVKNAIELDRQKKVGVVIAASPVSNVAYLVGKWLSNLALLTALVGMILGMAVVMQLVRGESRHIDVLALSAPLILIGMPVMTVVAGVAVLFESIPLLRSGFGNVVYFFLWIFVLVYSIERQLPVGALVIEPGNDLLGLTIPIADMQKQVQAIDPNYNGDFSIGVADYEDEVRLFEWQGATWTVKAVLMRIFWAGLGLALAVAAAIPFDRFDPARERRRIAGEGARSRLGGAANRFSARFLRIFARLADYLAAGLSSQPLGAITLAELRLALRGYPWWLYLTALGLVLAGIFSPAETAVQNLLPFAWILPILAWSGLGTREARYRSAAMVFSAPYPIRRQLPAAWLAGAVLALLSGSGVALRLLLDGELMHLLALLIGACFIPALALALGVWSGTGRLFELVYLLWWYLIVNGAPALDFMGTSPVALQSGRQWIYLAGTLVLLVAAAVGRYRQINR